MNKKNNKPKRIVISLGGSIIVPGEIDTKYIKKFKTFIEKQIQSGFSFIIVTGGGKTARRYQGALREIGGNTVDDLDWLGIASTRLNAVFLKLVLGQNVHQDIVIDPEKVDIMIKDKIIIGAGWKPGWSTDYVAVKLAEKFRAQAVINLSDIDYVYDKDPDKFKDAKPIQGVSWLEFKKIVGGVWKPGVNLPFDPIAAKLAMAKKIQVAVLNGRKLANLSRFLAGKKFKGTVIN